MKKGFTTIKMARRTALKLLADSDCRVMLDSEFQGEKGVIYTTRHSDFVGDDIVYIHELKCYTDIENIVAIEYTNRFGLTSFMEVCWDD